MSTNNQDLIGQLKSQIAELSQALDQANHHLQQTVVERDRANFLFEINTALNIANLDIDAIITIVVNLTERLGATLGEVYLITDAGQLHFKSSDPARNNLDIEQQEKLLLHAVSDGPIPHALDNNKILLIPDVQQNYPDVLEFLDAQLRSLICVPLVVDPDWPGAIIFGHHTPHFFTEYHTSLLEEIATQITIALEKATDIRAIKSSLHETHLMLDISRQLAKADSLNNIYDALVHAAMSAGANRCVLYTCEELGKDSLPIYAQVVFTNDDSSDHQQPYQFERFRIANYPVLHNLIKVKKRLLWKVSAAIGNLPNAKKNSLSTSKHKAR